MKNQFLFLFRFVLSLNTSAQLTVDVNGNIGIGDTITSYNSQLSVNGAGLNYATVYVHTGNRDYGIYSENIATNNIPASTHVGVFGKATKNYASNMGCSIGVYGTASNSTNGLNYGVLFNRNG